MPPPPKPPACTCAPNPDPEVGCPVGTDRLYFSLASSPDAILDTLCVQPLHKISDISWSFSTCFRRACLSPAIQASSAQVIIKSTTPTAAAATLPLGPSTLSVVALEPPGLTVSGSALTTDGNNQVAFSSTQTVTVVPPTGFQSVTIQALVNPGVDDVYYALILTSLYAPVVIPPEPTASCPCWEITPTGVCPGIQVPITLVGHRLRVYTGG